MSGSNDKTPNDDYYYDKVNNNVVTVDHLNYNGFTLPFQHVFGSFDTDLSDLSLESGRSFGE